MFMSAVTFFGKISKCHQRDLWRILKKKAFVATYVWFYGFFLSHVFPVMVGFVSRQRERWPARGEGRPAAQQTRCHVAVGGSECVATNWNVCVCLWSHQTFMPVVRIQDVQLHAAAESHWSSRARGRCVIPIRTDTCQSPMHHLHDVCVYVQAASRQALPEDS